MGTAPRLTKSNSILKNGVMFEGGSRHQKNSPFGPGHYFVEQDSLNKKSFNARVANNTHHTSGGVNSNTNQSVLSKSPRNTPTRSPLNSPLTPRSRTQANTRQSGSQNQGQTDNSYLFQNRPKTVEEYQQRMQQQYQLQSPPPNVFGGMLSAAALEQGNSPPPARSQQPAALASSADEPLTIEQLSLEP